MGSYRPTITLKTPPVAAPPVEQDPPDFTDGRTFWLIWRVGARRPSRQHATLGIALAELSRLQSLHQRAIFAVFEARAISKVIPQ